MNIQTLEHTSIDEITEVFNRSFADYLVPFKLTKEQLAFKIQAENIQLAYSAGAFEDNHLVGFMLHGLHPTQKVAYNAGTGVVPKHRGQRLTEQMYGCLRPLFGQAGIKSVQLEVIRENIRAFKSYETVGFRKVRELICFKGTINLPQTSPTAEIKPLENSDWAILDTFWDWQPTWQNAVPAMENSQSNIRAIGIVSQNELLAYAVFNPTSKRIHQFAVHKQHRNQGLGHRLFGAISEVVQGECFLINVESASTPTFSFLTAIGLRPFIQQYEMVLNLETIS